MFRKINRAIQKIPGVQDRYLNHYGTLKHSFLGFGKKLGIAKTPVFVHWHATYECNFRCEHCSAEGGEKTPDPVPLPQILRALKDMGDLGVRKFIITGGEPLLRKDVFEVFHAAHEAGIPNTALATNGYLVEKFEKELTEARLSAVHISIDGLPETNDRTRGVRHASKKAWRALSFFEDIGVKERVLNTIVHKENIHELEKLTEYVYDSSATIWNLQIALGVGRAKRHDYLVMEDKDIRDLFHFALKARRRIRIQMAHHLGYLGPVDRLLRPEPFFCGAGTQTCAILAGGEVVGCQVYYDPSSAEGNIKRESFKDIWERLFVRFYNTEREEECMACEHFSACLGGCSAYRDIEGRCCLKDVWENLNTSGR